MKSCLAALPEIETPLRNADRILIATDFDGTLCPIADVPEDAHLAPATLGILRRLAAHPRLTLAVLSGRGLADVRRRVPLEIIFAGNHGLEIEGPGIRFEHPEASQLRPAMAAACAALHGIRQRWPGAWVEDKGWSATLHFRQVDPRRHHELLLAARRCLGAFGPALAFRAGKRALEVLPKVKWDKGCALQYIRRKAGPFPCCICIGDDRTDETMFRASPGQWNIRIGPVGPTAASHFLADPAEVAILLSYMVDVCDSPTLSRDLGPLPESEPTSYTGLNRDGRERMTETRL